MSETYQGLITITDLTDNKACEIRGVNVFKYNENGEIPSASSSITLTAILSDNISGSNWQYKNALGNFVNFSPITTGDTITINHTDDIFINDIATIKKLTSDESVFDIFTITKIRDGSPGDALINAVLSNDNQIIPCDGSGIPFESAFPISSKITIYEGAEDITNKYSISVTIQSDSGVPRLIGSISGDTFTATSWNTLSQSYYTATVTFTCTRTGYSSINKVLTLSKVATGSSPNYYELTYDILATNKNISNIFNPSSVTFRANHINGELTEDYQGYLKLYRVKLDGAQETITTSNMSSDGASGYKYTYTFSQTLDVNTKYLLAELYKTNGVGDCLDKQSIIVTSDGQTGASPINIVLGNVADVIPCDVDGKLKTNLTIDIPFTAYKGTSQISATITKSNITTRPSNLTDDNITITSSTSSSSGNIQFTLYAGSELGNNSGEITLTFTCDGKQVPMKYGWSKSIQAPPGADGKTYYTWIKYADSPTSGMSDNPSGKAYIGIAHNKTSATESTTYSDYTWSLIKGETGADGNGITTIKQYYARTTTFSKPSAESITSTKMPELDNTYRYLWMKEVIAFTKSENQTVITLIAARGDNGEMSPEQVAQLNKASQDAAKAQNTADSKRRVFYNTPTVPYDAGDLWVQGSGGDILRCAQAKTSTGSYDRNDWVLASKYTDDSALNTRIEGDFATTIKALEEGLVDAKIETYYQTTDPSTGWSDTQKSEHKGDLWYNSTASVQKYYRWSGTAWQELTATPPQAVFDNIDKKATIYTGTTTPTNPSSGDLWFKGTDEPILTYVNNSWVEYNKYTDDSAANNLELTKIDRFGTNASMKWDGNILKIEAVDPETNVPYAVEIGGNGIEFKYDNEAVAMINQDQLVIDKTVVLTEMQVNRYWTWRTRDNNNLCLQWIGGSN